MRILLFVFVLYPCLCFNYYVLFHLNHNIAIECLALINGFVLVKLKNHTNLGLVLHGKEETFHDVLIFDDEAVSLAMESEIFLIKIDGIFTSRHRQIDLIEGDDGLSSKRADFCLF